MADLSTLQGRLTEAEAALHALTTGQQVVLVQTETERVQYAQADQGRLETYVAELRSQILAAGGPGVRRRAIGVRF